MPDLIDFCVIKGIPIQYLKAESCLDLPSDHSPVIITVSSEAIKRQTPPHLSNKHTDWENFRSLLDEYINLGIPLKSEKDIITAVEHLTQSIQNAAWESTPTSSKSGDVYSFLPICIKQKIAWKR